MATLIVITVGSVLSKPEARGASAASFQYLSVRSPLYPRSSEECAELSRRLSQVTGQLSLEHDNCLNRAPMHEGAGSTCARISCQSLHTTRDEAQKYASKESATCQQRLNSYLESERKKAEAERKRKNEAEAKRQARQLEEQIRRQEARREAERERQAGVPAPVGRTGARPLESSTSVLNPIGEPAGGGPVPDSTRVPDTNPFGSSPVPNTENDRLTDEQKEILTDTAVQAVLTYLSQLSVINIRTAVARAIGGVGTNGVLDIAREFLDVENARNIDATVKAAVRQRQTGTINANQARLLQQLEEQERK